MRPILTLLFLLFFKIVCAQWTVETVPNQKLIDGGYVSNPDHVLSDNAVVEANSLLGALELKTTVQVAVVALQSIGDADVFTFSQDLFNTWGIGQKSKSNGLLILLVMDSHIIRFHTGYGLESTLPDATCKQIQREYMVPLFREGNYDAGLLNAITEIEKVLTNPVYAEELNAFAVYESEPDYSSFFWFVFIGGGILLIILFLVKEVNSRFTDSKKMEPTPHPEIRTKRMTWLVAFALNPLLIVIACWIIPMHNAVWVCSGALYLYFLFTLFWRRWREHAVTTRLLENKSYYEITEFLRKNEVYWLLMGLLFPAPFLIYFFIHKSKKSFYRNHPRACASCNGNMIKLDDIKEDSFLSKSQLFEESLKAIDYDVWKCEQCEKTQIWNYVNRFSVYDVCQSCKTKAKYFEGRRTIKDSTYTSTGTGEETHRCKFCNGVFKSTYVIAMKTKSSDSSGSGSYSSSSSSSGGSWGGGSSGGGGSSSSW